MLFSSDLIKAL